MKYRIYVSIFFVSLLFYGCAGKFEYIRPSGNLELNNSIVVNKSKEEIWTHLIPALGKRFFVINNLDKDSGIINVSYSGDPEKYVDCGSIHSYVKNLRGERTYDFPASKAAMNYEVMQNGLFFIYRTMALEGRINIIIERLDDNKSRATVNVRYIVNKSANVTNAQGFTNALNGTASFDSGQEGEMTGHGGQVIACRPTGKLEEEILSLITE